MTASTIEWPATSEHNFTMEYFLQEVCRFRQLFGQKDFWAKPREVREAAEFAIGFVYIRLNPANEEENQKAKRIYEATMDEYQKREILMLFR